MAFTYNGISVVEYGGYMAMFDWAVIWPIFTFIMKYLAYIGVAIVILVLVMIPQIHSTKRPGRLLPVRQRLRSVQRTYA